MRIRESRGWRLGVRIRGCRGCRLGVRIRKGVGRRDWRCEDPHPDLLSSSSSMGKRLRKFVVKGVGFRVEDSGCRV